MATSRYEEIRIASELSNAHRPDDFVIGAEWADNTMIERACRCYCDNLCERSLSGMCFHKNDHLGQIKNDFNYNECNELKLIRRELTH